MLRSPLLGILVLTLNVCVLATAARAQIGASPQQCQTHYGHPVSTTPTTCLYSRENLSMAVTFYEGRAQAILFKKAASDAHGLPAALSSREINQLMKANSDGRAWKALPTETAAEIWMTGDGILTAMYSAASRTLLIMDKGATDRRRLAEHLLKAPIE